MSSTTSSRKCSIADVNALGRTEFVATFGGVYENSPWIASEAAARRPFASCDDLAAALEEIVRRADRSRQLALIRAHPDLAGRLAAQGALTAESAHEQSAAGLATAPAETIQRIQDFNAAYRARFGFPFVICARLNNVETILAAMESRIHHTAAAEMAAALAEIFKIARLRLADIIA